MRSNSQNQFQHRKSNEPSNRKRGLVVVAVAVAVAVVVAVAVAVVVAVAVAVVVAVAVAVVVVVAVAVAVAVAVGVAVGVGVGVAVGVVVNQGRIMTTPSKTQLRSLGAMFRWDRSIGYGLILKHREAGVWVEEKDVEEERSRQKDTRPVGQIRYSREVIKHEGEPVCLVRVAKQQTPTGWVLTPRSARRVAFFLKEWREKKAREGLVNGW